MPFALNASNAGTALTVGDPPLPVATSGANAHVVASDSSGNVTVINGSSTAVRFYAPRLPALPIGYQGRLAVYSLNGRQILKTSFDASATNENILRIVNKIVARGVYRYRFLKDGKIMDEGNCIVR